MSTRPKVDPPKIRRRLATARDDLSLVRIRRRLPGQGGIEDVDGFVNTIGAGWVLLARFDQLVVLDGWTALRLADVAAVDAIGGQDGFEVRALKARGQWPPQPPAGDVPLDDVRDVLRFAATAPLVTVHRERERPDACWIGAVRKIGREKLTLLEVDPRAEWGRETTRHALADLTRVDVGGSYEQACTSSPATHPADRSSVVRGTGGSVGGT